jgi:hypothetical protein
MEEIDVLSDKIRKLTQKYKEIQEKNAKLKAKVDFLEQEYQLSSMKVSEYVILKKIIEKSIIKIESILKTIENSNK